MSDDPFDPAALRHTTGRSAPAAILAGPNIPALPAPAKGEHYLGGTIPLRWLSRAAALPGKALHVALALWHQANLSRGKCATVQPRRATLREFGAGSRRTLYRTLAALEAAGLISVEHRTGRPSLVTILDPGPLASAAALPG